MRYTLAIELRRVDLTLQSFYIGETDDLAFAMAWVKKPKLTRDTRKGMRAGVFTTARLCDEAGR